MGYVTLILRGLVAWLEWQVIEAKIRVKMLLIDRKEKYENEEERTNGEIADLHAAGEHERADVLYQQLLSRTEFLVDLSTTISEAEEGNSGADSTGSVPPTAG